MVLFDHPSTSDQCALDPKRVVLIVEDEILIRIAIADYLRDVGYSVIESANAQDAIEVVASRVPVDLVFTDINMPGEMDGQSLANWLLAHRPELPVILTSGASNPPGGSTNRRRFIAKPYLAGSVEQHIRELLGPS
jgi:CheY-like chemotaxis protein